MVFLLTFFADILNAILPSSLALWLARKWAVNDLLPEEAHVIVPAAHGAKDKPTNGAISVTVEVVELRCKYPKAFVAWGTYGESPNPEVEWKYKRQYFGEQLHYGDVMVSIEECLGVKEVLPITFDKPGVVMIFVTDEAHSRRFKLICKTFFPKADVRVISVPLWTAIDPSSPMGTYHNAWRALILQAAPTPLYWWWARKGPRYLATKKNFGQPVAH